MILTDYYRFERLANLKSGSKIICTKSTKSYNRFEQSVGKEGLYVYAVANHTQAGAKGKSDLAFTDAKGKHLTSIYAPDITTPYWYGDTSNTPDALLMVHTDFGIINGKVADGSIVEVFVARGQKHNQNGLFTLLVEGDLDEEMQRLRERAESCHEPNTLY